MIVMSGPSGAAAIHNIIEGEVLAGRMTIHDRVVGSALANVLTGGPSADPLKPLTEDEVIALEREAFVDLLATQASIDRVKHKLATVNRCVTEQRTDTHGWIYPSR